MKRFILIVCILGGCDRREGVNCNMPVPPSVSLTAHLANTPEALSNVAVEMCRNAVCTSGSFGLVTPTDSPPAAEIDIASMTDELDGYTRIDVDPQVADLPLADGDVYELTITGATGASLLDVTRPVRYDEDVDVCDRSWLEAHLELYPTSASNVTCGNAVCDAAGATIDGSFETSDTTDVIAVTLCRGDRCGSATLLAAGLAEDGNVDSTSLDGGFDGRVALQRSGNRITYVMQTSEDSAALADGDDYSVLITQNAATLATSNAAATYSRDYLNGTACDPVPCRQATLHFP